MNGQGVPASKAWREGSSFRAISSDESACTVNTSGSIRGCAEGSCVTSVCTNDTSGGGNSDLVAFAHTDPYNARTNTSGLTFSTNEGNSATTNRFSGGRHTKTPSGIHDMTWIANWLFAGTASGSVLLYDTSEIDESAESNSNLEPTETFLLPHMVSGDQGAPRDTSWSQRVNQISVAPNDHTRFSAVDNANLSMWDVSSNQQVWISKVAGAQTLPTCELYRQNNNICMVGTALGDLRLFDFREAQTQHPQMIKQAHSGSVHMLKWSPFSPYWVASSGDDALIHVWDLRNTRVPAVVLTGHHNAVTQLTWSKSHAEILASGSWDRRVKIWNLNSPPQHMMDDLHIDKQTHKPIFTDMIAGVAFSHKQPMGCLVATSVKGEVATVSMNDKFLQPMVPHKLQFEDSDMSSKPEDCENHFYYREIGKAVAGAIKLAKEYQLSDERLQDADKLIEMCKAPPLIVEDNPLDPELSLDDSEVLDQFKNHMDEFSSYLAPKPDDPYYYINGLNDASIQQEFEFLEKSVKILLDLAMCRFDDFKERINVLRDEDPQFWTASAKKLLVLRRIIAEYLEADGPAAFEFASQMCEKFHTSGHFFEFGLIADLLVHPSVYECPGRKVTKVGRDHLQEHLALYNKIQLQIGLQQRILTILHDTDSAQPSAERIIHLFSEDSEFEHFQQYPHDLVDLKSSPQVVSLSIINSYFSALSVQSKWDDLIIQAVNLSLCLNVTTGYTKDLALVADRGYDELLRSASSNLSAEDTLKHLRMVLKVLAKCKEREVTPKFHDFLTKVTPEVSRLASSLTTFFEGAQNDPENDPDEARKLAAETYESLGRLKGDFENTSIERADQINHNHRSFVKTFEDLIHTAKRYSEELAQ